MFSLTKRIAGMVMVAAALATTSSAWAASTTGRLTGVVMDPTGLPVDNADVSLASPQMIGGSRTGKTSPEGEFHFTDLPPGTYALTVKSEGFRDTRQEGIHIQLGQSVQLDVVLEPPVAQTQEAYVVTAAPTTVDTERTQLGTSVNQSFTSRVFTSRDYQGVALMAPGVVDISGTDANADGNPVIHGANQYSNQYLVDGINMTDPVTNTFSRNFNFDAIEDVEVLTGGRDAEYGGATGGVINVVTKSGGNDFTADGSIYFSPDTSELARRNILGGNSQLLPEGLSPYRRDETPRSFSSSQANLNLGGPIIKDKLWFFTSHQVSMNQSQIDSSKFPAFGTHPPREFRAYYGLGKLTYQATPWQRFQVLVQGDPTSIANTDQDPRVRADAETHQNQGGGLLALSSDTNIGEHVLWKNKVALFSSYIQTYPESEDFDTPGRTNITTNTFTGNGTSVFRDTRNRAQLTSQVVLSWDRFLGSHETKLGMDAMVSWNKIYQTIPGGSYYRDTGTPDDPNQAGIPSEQVRVVEPQNTAINGNTIGLYVQDVWKPFHTLTIRPGIRFDSSQMRNDKAGDIRNLVANPFSSSSMTGWMQDQANAFGNVFDSTIVQLNVLSPRLGVAWDPLADGKSNLHAGYYRYTDTSYLTFPSAVGRTQRSRYYSYNPVTGRYDRPGREEGGVSGTVVKPELSGFNPRKLPTAEDVDLSNPLQPSIQGWDPLQVFTGHHAPKTDEVVVGFNRELLDSVSLSVDAIGRLITNLYEDDETNLMWNADGSDVVDGRNGRKDAIYSLGTPDAAYQIYYGIDVNLRKRLTDKFEGMISYSFSVNRGTSNAPFSVAFDREKQDPYLFGFLELDRRHVLRILGYYHLPLGFVAGGSFSYISGGPYNKFSQNAYFGDYADLRAPRGYDPANPGRELRLPDILESNTRVMWDAESLLGQKLWLIMDVENMLNLRGVTSVEQRDLPAGSPTSFGQPLSYQAPIQFTFGARFQY